MERAPFDSDAQSILQAEALRINVLNSFFKLMRLPWEKKETQYCCNWREWHVVWLRIKLIHKSPMVC